MKPASRVMMVLGLAGAFASAARANITLDFEGLGNRHAIGSTYSAMGLSFSSNFRTIVDRDFGGSGRFDHNPSGDTVAGWGRPGQATITSVDGLTEAIGLHYSSSRGDARVQVWSGANGTGDLLASLELSRNADRFHRRWDEILIPFTGEAHSIQFIGKPGAKTYIDDVTLTVVPVPAAAGLGAIGLALVGWLRRRAA